MDGTDIREPETDAFSFEAELDGASLMEQFLSDPSHDYKTLKYGDVLEGIIMHIDRDELLVDIGSKAEGIVPAKEYSSLSAEEKDALQVGDTLLVFVVQPENAEGHPVVSIDRARQEKSWRRLQELHEANEIIEAEVTNYNKGGLLVNLDGVRGFVPASQVSEIRGGDDSSKQADMARLIGSKLPLKVIEINRHRNRLILSERQAIQERRDIMKERLIEELKEGDIRKGRVSSICDFGAFVDIGGADGLVHLSELSWSRVRHPGELLKVGDEVDVYILGVYPDTKKIALSIKRTQAEPWSRVATSYEVGQLVKGTVTQLANFGAFARIEDGIEGLIHVSELADERIQHPKQVVGEGQDLILRIIRIDPQRRRMGLSLRRALDTPDAELEAVFGEGIVEERDALVQKIRAALEAEGLTGTSQSSPDSSDGEGSGTAVAEADAPAVDLVAQFEERRQRAEESAAQRRSREQRQARQQSQSDQSPSFEDEDMSAMALAFALAGALDDETPAAEEAAPAAETATEAAEEAADRTFAEAAGDVLSVEDAEDAAKAFAPAASEREETATEAAEEAADRTLSEAAGEVVTETAAETAAEVFEGSTPDAETETATEAAEAASDRTFAEADGDVVDEVSAADAATAFSSSDESGAPAKVLGPAGDEGKTWVAGNGTNDVPDGFPIKGNADSHIYHTPESPWYGRTIAEVYYATTEAAEAAGYRAPEGAGHAAATAAERAAEAAADETN
ncbi:MAG: 30S ribosomal protein S1 [Thermomicrobiales bacterium]